MKSPALKFMKGLTSHVRFVPFRRAFKYKVKLISVDIERLDEADRQSKFFSVDKFNFMSLETRKRGSLGKHSLSDWARTTLQSAGILTDKCTIRLITFPTILGYSFSPLSLWICETEAGELAGLIYEVNNTFGEQHAYVAAASPDLKTSEVDKSFHVSPFFDVSGRYRFTNMTTANTLRVLIENIDDNQRLHAASLDLHSQTASNGSILKTMLITPFAAIGVPIGIHWQALALWIKGCRYRSKPQPPEEEYTVADTVKLSKLLNSETPA